MRVAEWFPGWAVAHCEAIPRHDWPAFEDRYWTEFRRAFVALGITQAEADAATSLVARSSPGFPDKHLPAVLEAVGRLREARAASGRSSDTSCPECAGEGLTSRRFRFEHRGREIVASLACYCQCRDGRGIHTQHEEAIRDKTQAVHPRIVDLALRPDIVSLCHPPGDLLPAEVVDAIGAAYDLFPVESIR